MAVASTGANAAAWVDANAISAAPEPASQSLWHGGASPGARLNAPPYFGGNSAPRRASDPAGHTSALR